MNRHFYFFAIFFTALNFFTGFANSLLFLWLRGGAFTFPNFAQWLIVSCSIGLIAAMLQLQYYQHKKYRLAFVAGILYTAAFAWQCFIVFTMMTNQKMSGVYNASNLSILIAGLLYSMSLLFSNARKKIWLSAAGIGMFLTVLISLFAFTWLNHSNIGYTKFQLTRIIWLATAAFNLVFILFIINYASEYRILPAARPVASRRLFLPALLLALVMAVLVPTIIFGWRLAGEIRYHMAANEAAPKQQSELAEPFEAGIFVARTGDSIRYRFLKPVDYDPKKKYPLVVCLHHGGTHGTDNSIQIDGSGAAQFLSWYTNRVKYPAFIFVPQCPKGYSWQDIDTPVFETIEWLEANFPVNTKKIYVTGLSGGGFGTWDFIGARPGMFAAAIPVCGAADTSIAVSIAHTPIWAFQGEKDDLVPPQLQREMIGALRNAGGHPRYTEFPGAGHNIWDEVSQTPGLLDWLFAQELK